MQINRNQFIKFLVASDNHLGANENVGLKSNRYQDAFDAFEEVLQIAQNQCVDFLILGGDLFHEKHPTEHCLLKCVDILQRYVFGDNFGGIQMEINSLNYQPNFSCSNFNIQLPIFIINGNHDDIVTEREESVSILDILHESKYLNYIGKITDQSFVSIKPVVLVKNNQKVALYGLGYMKDYQLYKLINEGKLILELLDENNFNILIIHQNRNKGTYFSDEKNFIDPLYFRKFNIDLIVWGHEHEAKYTLEQCEHYQVFFAGSTVATSLIEYEAIIKQAGLFTLARNEMKFESIKLEKSYRPIIYKSLELSELVKSAEYEISLSLQEIAEKLLYDTVEKELVNYYQTSKYRQKKPLLRFKIEYSGFELMKMRFLETKFADRVSNPDKIFQFWEKRSNLQKQIEKRQEQAKQLNMHFDDIFKSKVEVTSQNQSLLSEFSLVLQNKLNQQTFSVIEQGDFINIFDGFLTSSNKEKNNLFNDLYSKSVEKFKNSSLPQYYKRMSQVLQNQREYQEYLTFSIRDSLMKDFSSIQHKTDEQQEYTDFLYEINSVFTKFQEEFKLEATSRTSQGQKNCLSFQPQKQFSFTKPQQIQEQSKDIIVIEDDSVSQKGQTQTSIFGEDDDIEEIRDNKQNKKGPKKRKPIKKEEELQLGKPQKQKISIPPYTAGIKKFF